MNYLLRRSTSSTTSWAPSKGKREQGKEASMMLSLLTFCLLCTVLPCCNRGKSSMNAKRAVIVC